MSKSIPKCIVAAVSAENGIGFRGALPWGSLSRDMARFKSLTTCTLDSTKRNAVIMGRKTWESIPQKFRPLPGRLNVLVSRVLPKSSVPKGVLVARSLPEAYELAQFGGKEKTERAFVIGGGKVYREALMSSDIEDIYMTRVFKDIPHCDTFFPSISDNDFIKSMYDDDDGTAVFAAPSAVDGDTIKYNFETYNREGTDATFPMEGGRNGGMDGELQYLDLIKRVISDGDVRDDRTGTGTLSRFGESLRFNLENRSLPLLTTKKVFFRGIAEELLWFLSGSTDATVLSKRGVKIWDKNGERENLDRLGLRHRDVGDLGPIYGHQWRHFGASYRGSNADYSGEGFDQVAYVVDALRNNPTSRRIVMSSWNPNAISQMVLPPCHVVVQFYVHNRQLSSHVYQRSGDLGLGVPFNIASYAILTHLMAHVSGLEAKELILTLGDAHVYTNHVDALQGQLQNTPLPPPKLLLNPSLTEISDFSFSDMRLHGYTHSDKISMQMAL